MISLVKIYHIQLYGLSRKFGSALLRAGAKRGDVIGLVLPNIPEYPVVFLGKIGHV